MVLLKLNEFHEQKQGAPSLNSKLKDVNKDDQKETKPKTSHDPILPKSKDKSPSDPGGNSGILRIILLLYASINQAHAKPSACHKTLVNCYSTHAQMCLAWLIARI